MNEQKIKQLEVYINSLVALRNAYISIIVILSGGIIGLFYNLTFLNVIFLVLGAILDFCFVCAVFNLSQQIYNLIRLLGGK